MRARDLRDARPRTFIEVQTSPTLFNTYNLPMERIYLPIHLEETTRFLPLVQHLLISVVAILITGWLFFGLAATVSIAFIENDIAAFLIGAAICGLPLALTVPLSGVFFVHLADLHDRSPLIVISEDGILDRRQMRKAIQWVEVESVRKIVPSYRSWYFRSHGVLLTLRKEIHPRINIFRFGALTVLFRKKSQIYIPLEMMFIDGFMLDKVVTTLAQRAGAQVRE
ncbi:hypothetical protein [Flaviflagellibacter deserti]|uniref:Bacterial Pleckstrin homology domain-containing protein n=1 Tax=Flaviflagellibacter deserti TaxID=2267266 RepID=A0ABV9Z119_9HYPH